MRPDEVLDTLQRAGFEAWYVGGCVRDTLLGRPIHDWDVTTSALPEQVLALFPRTVPTGLQHGTVTVLSDSGPVEVTTYRADGDYHDGRHPDGVRFVRSLREDTARRDFTVNAMAMDQRGNIRDFYGGRADLAASARRSAASARMRCGCCARAALPRSSASPLNPKHGQHCCAARRSASSSHASASPKKLRKRSAHRPRSGPLR